MSNDAPATPGTRFLDPRIGGVRCFQLGGAVQTIDQRQGQCHE